MLKYKIPQVVTLTQFNHIVCISGENVGKNQTNKKAK